MNEIVCRSGVGHLMDYLEGVLPASLVTSLEEHVAGCARCLAFIASYRDTPRILRNATEATLSADRRASLRAFLRGRRD
jgi:hypothetical protein